MVDSDQTDATTEDVRVSVDDLRRLGARVSGGGVPAHWQQFAGAAGVLEYAGDQFIVWYDDRLPLNTQRGVLAEGHRVLHGDPSLPLGQWTTVTSPGVGFERRGLPIVPKLHPRSFEHHLGV